MLFSSLPFLFYFLPCALGLYFLVPRRLKNAALLLCSLVFYAWGEPRFVLFMAAAILQGYAAARLMERYPTRRRLLLTLSVVLSLGMLAYCKYADFLISGFNAVTGLSVPLLRMALPIGISFYTFQILSYVVDVRRGDASAQKNPIDLAAYIAMFPQLIAGPIVRYTDVAAQLRTRTHTRAGTAAGTRRFVLGLAKKILIANVLGQLVQQFQTAQDPDTLFHWLYAVGFMLQIYFDFSAYSDMAIGLGAIFGFTFPENFNYPYCSASITEFWRRWHISLGSWFRDYVYIPLGGSRVGKWKLLRNLLLVWAATGLWHGAAWNFVLWGLFYAVLLIAEKFALLPKLQKHPAIGRMYTLLFVLLGFVLFDAPSLSAAASRIAGLFGGAGAGVESLYYLRSYAVVLLLAVLGATPLPKRLLARLRKNRVCGVLLDVLEPIVLVALLALCTAYLIDGSFNPFLYFRF